MLFNVGYYLYVPSGGNIRQGQVARLRSPVITSASCLSFYYNMEGSSIGELGVFVQKQGSTSNMVWSLGSDQGQGWKKGVVQLPGSHFQVIQSPKTANKQLGS